MSIAQLVIGIAVGYAIFLLFAGLAAALNRDPIQMRFDQYAGQTRTLEQIDLRRPFTERVLQPLLRTATRVVLRFVPRLDMRAIQLKLQMAGSPNEWTPADFVGVRVMSVILAVLFPLTLLLLRAGQTSSLLLLVALSAVLGLYLPVVWLNSKIRARQKDIRRNLPDALDLLTLSVEAGLSFENAMAKVGEHSVNELTLAFERAMTEIQLGKARSRALRDLSDQAGVSELSHFVMSLIQADQLGVSIVKVLRIQSDEMRVKRRQRAEEEAHRAPVKMSIVLVLLLLPALFLIMLGPSVQRICHMFTPDNPFCGG
jgi:tight adherence protein C